MLAFAASNPINQTWSRVHVLPVLYFLKLSLFMPQAGISSQQFPEQLVIALEPEAASIYIRKLRMSQLVPQHAVNRRLLPSTELIINTQEPASTSVELVADGLGPGKIQPDE